MKCQMCKQNKDNHMVVWPGCNGASVCKECQKRYDVKGEYKLYLELSYHNPGEKKDRRRIRLRREAKYIDPRFAEVFLNKKRDN